MYTMAGYPTRDCPAPYLSEMALRFAANVVKPHSFIVVTPTAGRTSPNKNNGSSDSNRADGDGLYRFEICTLLEIPLVHPTQ